MLTRMKSTWEKKWMRRENSMPNGKWPNLNLREWDSPLRLSQRALPGNCVFPIYGAPFWHYAAASHKLSSASKPGISGITLLGWTAGQQCSSLWIWRNTQKSQNCGILPLNAMPRERVLSLPQHELHSHELPGKMFSRKLNHKTLSDAQNTSTLRLASHKASFSHYCWRADVLEKTPPLMSSPIPATENSTHSTCSGLAHQFPQCPRTPPTPPRRQGKREAPGHCPPTRKILFVCSKNQFSLAKEVSFPC